MSPQLFISYSWTNDAHRSWVRLLASHLHAVGYNVMIDEKVEYGDSLNGFMRQIQNADHVLMIVDENYVDRANNHPTSGVGYENQWIESAFNDKPDKPKNWLTALFVENPDCNLPNWLSEHNPKSFDFRARPEQGDFPGSVQIDELWRWIEGLPADKSHANKVADCMRRSARIEKIDWMRDPSTWANPKVSDTVQFKYEDAPGNSFKLGVGEYEFTLEVTSAGYDSVYVYSDKIHSIGLVPEEHLESAPYDKRITPGRIIQPRERQGAILMNEYGHLCLVRINSVQPEVNDVDYIPPQIEFTYHILDSESQKPLSSFKVSDHPDSN